MVVWINWWIRWISLNRGDRSPQSAIRSAIGHGLMGMAATAIATALAAPIAQAQNLTMLRCLQAAGDDPYKVAQCSNPNARPPNLEEQPANAPSGNAPNRPANRGDRNRGSNSDRPAVQPATIQRTNTTNRPGVPASSYNSANRVRATLDCLSNYGTSTNQVLSECGAWSPRPNSGRPATATPNAAPGGNGPSTMPPPPGTNGSGPGGQPTILWQR
ncbi:MAG: hypothetical protein EA001_06875 [Oscillatoriales cyanobacterium]|nr:MAG: hypothetical protein EA001_06875 [Oscillatoriales cyanobacterium]